MIENCVNAYREVFHMFAFKSPSEYLSLLRSRLTQQQKTAFISTVLTGFICHLFILTNSMYNHDDIRYLYVDFDKPELGRWLQTYAAGISSYFSMPVVNGILALFYAGITSMVIVQMFNLKRKLTIILASGIFITFPTVAVLYSFMFAADPFLLSCLLSALAAYYVTRTDRKWGWALGAFFLCCSVAIYQAYLAFALILMLLFFILMLLQPSHYSDQTILTMAVRYVIMLACGMGAYYIGMKLTLKIKHTQLSSYQGIGSSSIPGFSQIRERLVMVMRDFIDFFKPSQVLAFNRWMQAALLATVVLLLLFFFTLYIRHGVYKSILRSFFLIFCMICIPLSVNVFYLISSDVNIHMLMRHAWCFLFIAVLIFFEKTAPLLTWKKQSIAEWASVTAAFLVLWNYILLSNIAYFNMNFRYEKTYALCIKIMDRIEQYEDYDHHLPMAFIGNFSKTYKMEATKELLEPMVGMSGPRVFGGTSRAYLPFFQNCLGEDITVVTPEEEEALKATPEFQEMPRFPNEGSIRVINGVTVIKLNDD